MNNIDTLTNQIGRAYEIESFILTPEETKKLYPLMNVSDISGWLCNPYYN